MSQQPEFATLAPEALAPARLLRDLGLEPKKHLGQSFLASSSAVRQILLALELGEDQVVEIGPGLGTLTGYLAQRASTVVAVELDEELSNYLSHRFSGLPHVMIVQADVLDVSPADLPLDHNRPYKLVGNLPYYITSPILRWVLSWEPGPQLVVIMVQEEVARRMVAEPGQISLLSLMVQLRGKPEVTHRIPAGSFVPRPRVNSAIVRVIPHAQPAVDAEEEARLFRLARAAFQQRRKMLQNSLQSVLSCPKECIVQLLDGVGIPHAARPQDLSVQQWIGLARAAPPFLSPGDRDA